MIHLNLLPWRQQQSHRRKWFLYSLGLSVIGSVLLAISLHISLHTQLKHHRDYNQFLQQQINNYQNILNDIQHIKKTQKTYFDFLKTLSQLRKKQIFTINLFNLIATVLPKGAYFNEIEKHNSQLILSGYTQNNKQVTILLQKISTISWLSEPKLKIIANKQYKHYDVSTLFRTHN